MQNVEVQNVDCTNDKSPMYKFQTEGFHINQLYSLQVEILKITFHRSTNELSTLYECEHIADKELDICDLGLGILQIRQLHINILLVTN